MKNDMNNEPIIFKIKENKDLTSYSITSEDSRAIHPYGQPIKCNNVRLTTIVGTMQFLTNELTAEGYKVLFEVEI